MGELRLQAVMVYGAQIDAGRLRQDERHRKRNRVGRQRADDHRVAERPVRSQDPGHARHDRAQAAADKFGGKAFADFMVSDTAQNIIKDFGVDKYGQPLFTADAGKTYEEVGLATPFG